MGNWSKPQVAVLDVAAGGRMQPSNLHLSVAIGEALRTGFQPVVDEPIPARLQQMIETLRKEEQERNRNQ